MMNTRNKRGNITTAPMDIMDKQLYTHKFDNLDEMEQFLGRQSVKPNIQEKVTWIGLISTTSVKSIVNNLPGQKALGSDSFTG